MIYFESQNCNFWGEGFSIISGTINNENSIIEKCNILLNENTKYYDNFSNNINDYIEYNITFNSGDEINILCKEIDYEEVTL